MMEEKAVQIINEKVTDYMKYKKLLKTIKSIPYTGYFMSSNLDHALYNIQNLDAGLKGEYAVGVPDTFPDSWKYIKHGLHSLERHSNLHIYFHINPYWI